MSAKVFHQLLESGPILLRCDWGPETARCSTKVLPSGLLEKAPCGRRAKTRQELENAEPGNAIGRVLDNPEHTQDVFDVSCLQKSQAAELHEWDVAPGELDFEFGTVMRGAEQNRL